MFQLVNVDKKFPGVHALKAVNFDVKKGEIVGLVGENGAGKSTLMKVIYGAYKPDGGQVLKDGKEVHYNNPREAMQSGIGMVFQEQSLILNLTVMENIFLGFEDQFVRFGVVDWKKMAAAAKKQLEKVELDLDPRTITADISFAQRQLVELAKVLTLEERVEGDLVILLDEPTSVLAGDEVQLLFRIVRNLTKRASFIFVSHRMDEVMEISDRIFVMKDGEVVDVVEGKNASETEIQRKMVGRDVAEEYYREEKQVAYQDEKLLSFQNVSDGAKYFDISFDLHKGEVLALVGTEGSGREAIIRTIYGMHQHSEGQVTINGEVLDKINPQIAVKARIGYVPRERKIEGVVAGMSVYENMTISQLPNYAKAGVLNVGAEKSLAEEWIKRFSIKTPNVYKDVGGLSGGNQQKVVLSKWRSGGAQIFLLDHPTRGLDIGAKEDVYEMIREVCSQGAGVILIADTLEEAIGLSHNILVIKDGRAQKYFAYDGKAKPTLFDLVHYMV